MTAARPLGRVLMLLNGEPPSQLLLDRLRLEADSFVCVDGGANTARALGAVPDMICGDLDSITDETRAAFIGIETVVTADQSMTDFQKAVRLVAGRGVRSVTVIGASGGRMDHALGNFSATAQLSRLVPLRLIDNDGETVILHGPGELTVTGTVGTVVSLIPLGLADGITTTGLRWPLTDEPLEIGVRVGTSNELSAERATIGLRAGTLSVYVGRGTPH